MRSSIAADPANKAAQRDLGFLAMNRGRALVQAGRNDLALPLLRSFVTQQPAASDDF